MKKLRNFCLVGMLCLVLVFSTASCEAFNSLFEDTVVTTEDNIKPEARDLVAVAPDSMFSSEIREELAASGKKPVLARKEDMIDPSKGIEVTNPGSNFLGTVAEVGLSVLGNAVPGLAILESIGVVLSRRKREHYVAAFRELNPMDEGYVDVKEAAKAFARALGLAHSEVTPTTVDQVAKPLNEKS